jgi:ABC-type multidrug transport system fused ATPase/permease subunit
MDETHEEYANKKNHHGGSDDDDDDDQEESRRLLNQFEKLEQNSPDTSKHSLKQKDKHHASWKRVLQLAWEQWRVITVGLLALVIRLPLALAMPHFMSKAVGRAIAASNNQCNRSLVYANIKLFFSVAVVNSALDYLNWYFFVLAQQRTVRSLRLRVYSSIMHSSMAFFDSSNTGELVSRLTSDCAAIANDLSWVFRWSVESIVRVIGISGYLMLVSWRLALVAYAIIPVIAVINKLYGNFLHSNSQKVQSAMASANSTAQEAIANARTVVSLSQQPFEVNRYRSFVDSHFRLCLLQGALDGAYFAIISSLLMQTLLAGSLLVYGVQLVLNGTISGDNLIAVTYFQGQLMNEFNSVLEVFLKLAKSSGSAEKIFELLDNASTSTSDHKLHNKSDQRDIDAESGNSQAGAEVTFDNVSFAYPTRPEVDVLRGVSFKQSAGDFLAICGSSGSGKSSCFNLVLGLYTPSKGRVLIDGIDVQSLDKRTLRKRIAHVGQDPTLFAGSVDMNIRYGELTENEAEAESSGECETHSREASSYAVREAAELANATPFIDKLPNGFATNVGERGVQLSGGQKQRIALARALYTRYLKVLLLDEATSHLDVESERLVQDAISKAMRGRTVIAIAHRLATVQSADKIVFMQNGRKVEQGTHDQLMQREGSYAHMVKMQQL